jgi:predicted DNA-binding transcriptional regulator YafY
LLSYPVWYVLAWDRLRGAVRTFRCDRIKSIMALDECFRLRPYTEFRNALDGVDIVLP